MEEEFSPIKKYKPNLPPLSIDDDEEIEEEDIVTKFSLRTPDVNMFLKTPSDNIKNRFWRNNSITPHAPTSRSSYTTPRRSKITKKYGSTPLTSPTHGRINTAALVTPRHKENEMNESQEIIRKALLLDTPQYIKRTSSNLHFVDPTLEEIRHSFKSFPLVANDLDICGQIVKEAQPNVTHTVKENPLYSNLLTIFEDTLKTQIANEKVNDLEHEILELFHLHRPLLRKITSVNPELGLFQNTLFGSTIQLLDKLNYKYISLEKDYNKLLEEKVKKEKLSEDVKARVKAEIEADSLRQHAAQLEVELEAYKKLFHEKAKALDAYKRTKGYNAMSWDVEKADNFFKKVDEMEDLMVVIESTVHKRVGIMDDMKQLINNLADVEAENMINKNLPKEE